VEDDFLWQAECGEKNKIKCNEILNHNVRLIVPTAAVLK
jgi:hypothetical protein